MRAFPGFVGVSVAATLLTAPSGAVAASPWEGDWGWRTAISGAGLTIDAVTDKGFHFSISGSHGANLGEAEGTARFTGPTLALARLPEFGKACAFTFELRGRALEVAAADCGAQGGLGVVLTGTYTRSSSKPPPPAEEPPIDIFFSKGQAAAFDALVGPDRDRFIHHVIVTLDDLDGLGARAQVGWPVHLAEDATVIMAAPDGGLWAGIPGGTCLHYYTTEPAWKSRVPKTMETWLKDACPACKGICKEASQEAR